MKKKLQSKKPSKKVVISKAVSGVKEKIQPLGDRVLVRELSEAEKEKTTASGIIIPVTVNDDKGAKRGEVVAVGKGRYDDGILIPLEVHKGDQVLFNWGDKIKVDGAEYYIVREAELVAVINN